MPPAAERLRATRFDVAAPLVYRRVGEEGWRTGHTVNVSRTGVLFVAPTPVLPPMTAVEFVIELPNPGVHGGSRVQCLGRIVRCRDRPQALVSVAATIDTYQLVKAGTEVRQADGVDS